MCKAVLKSYTGRKRIISDNQVIEETSNLLVFAAKRIRDYTTCTKSYIRYSMKMEWVIHFCNILQRIINQFE